MKKVEMMKWNETGINFVAAFCFTDSKTNIVRHSFCKVADTRVHGKVNLLWQEYCKFIIPKYNGCILAREELSGITP